MQTISTSLFFMVIGGLAAGANEATEQCVSAYKENLSQYQFLDEGGLLVETVARLECRSDGTAINLGYSDESKSLINSDELNIFGNYESNSKFCSDYKQGKFVQYTSTAYDRVPMVEMARQFNSCMELAREFRFAVWTSSNGPSEVVYHGQFFTAANTEIFFWTMVNYSGLNCYSPGMSGESLVPNGQTKKVKNEFSLSCRREGRADGNDTIYKAANVTVTMHGKPYPFIMKADRVFGEPIDGITSSQDAADSIKRLREDLEISERKNIEVISERDRLAARRYFGRIAYVGERDWGIPGAAIVHDVVPVEADGKVIRFPCYWKDQSGRSRLDPRNSNDRRILGDKLSSKVCSNNAVAWHYISHMEGDNCGYDAYLFICQK